MCAASGMMTTWLLGRALCNSSMIAENMMLAIEPFATDGAGEVCNAKPGNIYRVLRDREVRDKDANRLFQSIKEEFGSLPFCERWCTAIEPKASTHLKTLVRHGILFAYPVLSEVKGGMVSQTEHTLVINNGKGEITTNV